MNERNSVQFLSSNAGSFPVGDNLCCGEHTFTMNRWRAGAKIDLSNFAEDWQCLFVALPEGDRLVIELRRIAHVKIMFYLTLRRVCLSRSSASLLSAPFVGDVTAAVTQAARGTVPWQLPARSLRE